MTLPSELAGPALLSVVLAAAAVLAAHSAQRQLRVQAVATAACSALALQALHVAEEFSTGFHARLPVLLGLQEWSASFFIWFNLAWVAAWAAAIAALLAGRVGFVPRTTLLFLALAACGNAIWHPLLSVLTRSYFPGTVTSLMLGPAGVVLIKRLLLSPPTGRAAG